MYVFQLMFVSLFVHQVMSSDFYPRHINLTLLRDGTPVDKDELTGGSVLPNGNGLYQVRKRLTVSDEPGQPAGGELEDGVLALPQDLHHLSSRRPDARCRPADGAAVVEEEVRGRHHGNTGAAGEAELNTPTPSAVAVPPDRLAAALPGLYFSSGDALCCQSVSRHERADRLDF